MPRSPGRTGPRWQLARRTIFEIYDLCWICGKLVDKSLDGRLPKGPTVDHVIPLKMGGDPLELENLRLAHKSCNSARENRSRAKAPKRQLRRSRPW
jgi:5-methylcytosine-specific restriction endonuclease McrA